MGRESGLIRGMFYVLIANIINMVFNLITNFILPKYLSIDSYAAIKTYQLYISYIGALHLGFIDGMYLRYGGKRLSSIKKEELSNNLGTLRIFQIVMATVFIIISLLLNNRVLLFFSLAIVPLNMANYFTSLYQATGEFNRYGRIINATAVLNCCVNVIFIFLLKTDNYSLFLGAYNFINIIIWIFLEIGLKKSAGSNKSLFSFSISELLQNCQAGILLMLGNLSSFVLTGLDRWFVKFLMDTTAFAYYSFAVSMESFLNVAMNPVTVTLYNYFCKHQETERIVRVRNCVMIFASIIIAAAFPAKFILEVFLNNYIESTYVMFILFATQLFSMLNKGIYINLYKAQRRQKEYFIKLVIVIISGAVFNALCYWVVPAKESFAVGTLMSAVLWFVLNKYGFVNLKYSIKEYIYIILNLGVFISCGYFLNSIVGLIIYIIYLCIATFILMRGDFEFIIEYLLNKGVARGL